MAELIQRLQAEAARLGFASFGVADADGAPEAGRRLREWLADGRHGDMLWMAKAAAPAPGGCGPMCAR